MDDTLHKPTWSHFGVYALIRRERQILLVRKTRGPYTGLLDLPGGSPDPSDCDSAATLEREIAEETGFTLSKAGRWHDFSFLVTRDSSGRQIDLRHSGVWTVAICSPGPPPAAEAGTASPDTTGVVWIEAMNWRRRRDLSKLVRVVLAQAEDLGIVKNRSRG